MSGRLLLCTDLDRTLLPNGAAPESPDARKLFRRFCLRADLVLVYATGRDLGRIDEAIREYDLPEPDHRIADVGSTIVSRDGIRWPDWDDTLAADWGGRGISELEKLVGTSPGLRIQDSSRQGRFKLSYEVEPVERLSSLVSDIATRLEGSGVKVSVIGSHDEVAEVGLIDVLPESSGKFPAIDFVRNKLGFPADKSVFAGDSGNDHDVLVSPIPSVLVANASTAVKELAVEGAAELRRAETLYLANGGLMGMNGNYTAGILEGVAHFHPELAKLMESS